MKVKATPGKRFCAAIIDFILYEVVVQIIAKIRDLIKPLTYTYQQALEKSREGDITAVFKYMKENLLFNLVVLVAFFLYFVVLPYFWDKQTIGRLVTKTKVLYLNEKPSFGKIALREVVGTYLITIQLIVCCCIPGFINLVFLLGQENTVIADKIAGTTFVDLEIEPEQPNDDNIIDL